MDLGNPADVTREAIFGPPGTGKTHALIDRATDALKGGLDPAEMLFVSYTRRAVQEARTRLVEIDDHPFPNARTLHSLAYHVLGLSHSDVVQSKHLEEFSELTGNDLSWGIADAPVWEGSMGDRTLAIWELCRARDLTLDEVYRRLNPEDLPWSFVRDFVDQYQTFKKRRGLLDFGDMIQQVPPQPYPVEAVFVDEAQDLTTAQWHLLDRLVGHVPRWCVAGDDDQSIYRWSGADPHRLLNWRGRVTMLPKSHRLPERLRQLALRVTQRMHYRVPKRYKAVRPGGVLQWVNDPSAVDLSEGSWLLLARSRYQLREWRKLARQQGVVYTLANGDWSWKLPSVRAAVVYERLRKSQSCTRSDALVVAQFVSSHQVPLPLGKDRYTWDDFGFSSRERTWMEALDLPLADAEYVRALRRRGESLNQPGRVRISTVHGAKGAEADHVALLTDLSERVVRGAQADPDAELRVQYVAVTRARQTLLLIEPSTPRHWEFPAIDF